MICHSAATMSAILAVALAIDAGAQSAASVPPATPDPAPPTAVQPATAVSTSATAAVADTNFVVEVDGIKLTSEEAEKRATRHLDRIRDRVPAERMDRMRQVVQQQVMEEFVLETLVFNAMKKEGVAVDDADITKFIDENIRPRLRPGVTLEEVIQKENIDEADLRKDIRLQVAIQKLIQARMGTNAVVSDAKVEAYYQEHKEDFNLPESVHAQHILVALPQGADDKTRAAKKAKAESLRKQLIEGADFATLAASNSDCPSKEMGGDLGTFQRGRMVKEFEKAAFAQKTNEVGAVVETQFGYHIIRVLEHNAAKQVALEDAKPTVRQMLMREAEQTSFENLLEELRAGAKIVYGPGVTPPRPAQ